MAQKAPEPKTLARRGAPKDLAACVSDAETLWKEILERSLGEQGQLPAGTTVPSMGHLSASAKDLLVELQGLLWRERRPRGRGPHPSPRGPSRTPLERAALGAVDGTPFTVRLAAPAAPVSSPMTKAGLVPCGLKYS